MFRLTKGEKDEVVTNCDHLQRLKFSYSLPLAFTEHGALMAANVLNSPKAVAMSVYIIRAFLKLRETLRHQSIRDPLTGLFNRRYMESHLASLVEQAAARGKPIAVLILDIDYFKAVNDSHGHDAGDDVLREFSLRIRKSIRNIDLACRYGGEEFVIVMPETDVAVATMVAERIRRRIASEPFAIQQGARKLEVTISIGIAAIGAAGDNAAAILKRADAALYRAKRDGRNRVVPDAA